MNHYLSYHDNYILLIFFLLYSKLSTFPKRMERFKIGSSRSNFVYVSNDSPLPTFMSYDILYHTISLLSLPIRLMDLPMTLNHNNVELRCAYFWWTFIKCCSSLVCSETVVLVYVRAFPKFSLKENIK